MDFPLHKNTAMENPAFVDVFPRGEKVDFHCHVSLLHVLLANIYSDFYTLAFLPDKKKANIKVAIFFFVGAVRSSVFFG